ncbi:MAG: cation:proton antiporter [Gemmatimonadaceae bacterium]
MNAPWAVLAEAAAPRHDMAALLLMLAAVFAATKLFGELAQRLRQPAVLGELIAGVLLGGSVLGILHPDEPVVHVLSELGVLVLLFQIGLETDLAKLRRVGGTALAVGITGVVLPFAGGLAAALALGLPMLTALVIAAALTATSIGISARVLGDVGRLHTSEGQVVLGAAVLDDVVGLIILAVVGGIVAGGAVTVGGVARTTLVAVGFIVGALVLGMLLVKPLMAVVERLQVAGALGVAALAFAFVDAALAEKVGSATIIGAFAAGLVMHRTPQRHDIEQATAPLGHVLVPIFFASVGAEVDLAAMVSPAALGLGLVITIVAVLGKVAAGWAPWWYDGRKLLVGVAMVPRGEVGLIFAQMGAAAGVLVGPQFGAVMAMVVVTTFITPPLLGAIAGPPPPGGTYDEDEAGVDALVAGPSQRAQRARRDTVTRRKLS